MQVETSGLILELVLPAELSQNGDFNDLLADNAQAAKVRQFRFCSRKIGLSNLRIFIYDTLLCSFIKQRHFPFGHPEAVCGTDTR